MLGHAARSPDLRIIPTSALRKVAEPKVAVLLNANARKVTDRVFRSLTHVLPEEDLYLSRSQADVKPIVQDMLGRRYDAVFCGGGDGTFTELLNELFRQLEDRDPVRPARVPKLGILKLGTGNALAALVNASPLRGDRILDDVLRARAGEVPGYRRLDVLTVNGRRAVFTGLGLDGRVINDFNWVKHHLGRGLFSNVLSGELGYFTSLTLRTVPAVLTQQTLVRARVVNGAAPAYRLGPDGEPVEEFAPGAELYEGPLNFAGAGTSPFFGYEIKMFPFAGRRRGMMHLRLAAANAPSVLANLAKFWKGQWFPEGIHDFHLRGATIHLERPMPLQIGGDGEGYHRELELGMADPVELIDFTGSVQ